MYFRRLEEATVEARKEGPFAPEVMPPYMRGENVNEVTWLYELLGVVFTIMSWIAFPITIEGAKHFPKGEGYVLAPNHDNAFDVLLITLVHYLMGQPIHWLSKIELFGPLRVKIGGLHITILPAKVTTWFMYKCLNIPMTRPKPGVRVLPEREAIRAVGSILVAGGVVGTFPEGTRNRNGAKSTIEGLQDGVNSFARKAGLSVVPTSAKTQMPSLWPLRRGKFTMKYAEPLYPQGNTKEAKEQQRLQLRKSMEELGCFDR